MSVPSGYVRCHGCEFEGVMQHRSITLKYQISANEYIDSHRVFGWCSHCNGIRDIEAPLSVNALQREILELSPPPKTIGSILFKMLDRALGGGTDDNQAELNRLSSLLNLAQKRRSSPRCLTCGDASAVPLEFDEEGTTSNFVHTCGGRLYQVPSNPDAPRFSYKPEIIYLDSEGHRLSKI